MLLADGIRVPAAGHLADLPHGRYRLGMRVEPPVGVRAHDDDIPVPGTVELAEISGSETFIHVHGPGIAWVVQQDGVHR